MKRPAVYIAGIEAATEEDWHTEYLDLILSVKIVDNLDEAIDHINTFSSHHSDAIVTDSYANGHAVYFTKWIRQPVLSMPPPVSATAMNLDWVLKWASAIRNFM
ncbi:MAG: hypothetical protein MZV65_45185 [Chromatiales bacterium]|nr:hypothetical protein [Chromatiales bacterium]